LNLADEAARERNLIEAGVLNPARQRRTPPQNRDPLVHRSKRSPLQWTLNTDPALVSPDAIVPPDATVPPPAFSQTRTASSQPRAAGFEAFVQESSGYPADAAIAAGPNHILVASNDSVAVLNKDGVRTLRMSLEGFLRRTDLRDPFDPRVLFDAQANRFFLIALNGSSSRTNSVVVAVSTGPDPTGTWWVYSFAATGFNIPGQWIDYPSAALALDWLVISGNNFPDDGPSQSSTLMIIDRSAPWGQSVSFSYWTVNSDFTLVPAHEFGPRSASAFTVSSQPAQTGAVSLRRISRSGTQISLSAPTSLPSGRPWLFPFNAAILPQQGSFTRLDAGDSRMQSCIKRGDVVYCSNTIFQTTSAGTVSGARIWEIDTAQNRLRNNYDLVDPSGQIFLAYPSLAVNSRNDLYVGLAGAAANLPIYSYSAILRANNPTFSWSTLKVSTAPYAVPPDNFGRVRWGDYTGTTVDPSNDTQFWTAQIFASSGPFGSAWGVWVDTDAAAAPACQFTVSPTALSVPAFRNSQTIQVTASAPTCSWSVEGGASWAVVTNGSGRRGSGSVTIDFSDNPVPSPRSLNLNVAGRQVTVNQASGATISQVRISRLTVDPTVTPGGRHNIGVTFTIEGSRSYPNMRIHFTLTRTGLRDVTSAFFAQCNFTNELQANTSYTCAGPIDIPSNLFPGNNQMLAEFDPAGTYSDLRQAPLASWPATNVLARADAPVVPANGVTHAATNVSSPISPGQLVTLYGNQIGSPSPLGLQLDSSRRVSTRLGPTEVFVDNVRAPIIYSFPGQVAFVVPFSVAESVRQGRRTASIVLSKNDIRGAEVVVPLAAVAPAVFTANSSGSGIAAATNQNGSAHSSANPARRGEVITLYGSGFGLTSPQFLDGELAPRAALLRSAIRAEIAGISATVEYAGAAPGLVSGVVQINIRIPANSLPGQVPVRVFADGSATQANVLIDVR
jgi:uncharacterized protein (TIGR03437 family)